MWWIKTVSNIHYSLIDNGLFVLNMDVKIADVMMKMASNMFELISQYHIPFSRSHVGKQSCDNYYVLRKISSD